MPIGAVVVDSAQVLATGAVVATFYVQRRQFRQQQTAIRQQFEQQLQLSQGQNAFDLIKYLQQPDHMAARAAMREIAMTRFERWSETQRADVDVVCTLWQLAASIQTTGVLPPEFLQRNYGGTILWHWKICQPYVAHLRNATGDSQRRDFENLANDIEQNWPDAVQAAAARTAAFHPPPAPSGRG